MQVREKKSVHGFIIWIYLLSQFISPVYAEGTVPPDSSPQVAEQPSSPEVKVDATPDAVEKDPLWQQALLASEQAKLDAAKSAVAVQGIANSLKVMAEALVQGQLSATQIDAALTQVASATELAQVQLAQTGQGTMLVTHTQLTDLLLKVAPLLEQQNDAINQTEQALNSARLASAAAVKANDSAQASLINKQQQLTGKQAEDTAAKQAQAAAALQHEKAQAQLLVQEQKLAQVSEAFKTAELQKQTESRALQQAQTIEQAASSGFQKWQAELKLATAALGSAELKLQELDKLLLKPKQTPALEVERADTTTAQPPVATESSIDDSTPEAGTEAGLAEPAVTQPQAKEALQANAAAAQAQTDIEQALSAMQQARNATQQARDSAQQAKTAAEIALDKASAEHKAAADALPALTTAVELATQTELAAATSLASEQAAYDASASSAKQLQADFQQAEKSAQLTSAALKDAQQVLSQAQKHQQQAQVHQAEMAKAESQLGDSLTQLKADLASLQGSEKAIQAVQLQGAEQLKLADAHLVHVQKLEADMQAVNWTLTAPAAEPEEMVRLGKQLFFDRRLSGNGSMSCASCHSPMLGWGDGLPVAIGHKGEPLKRASPVIINVAYGKRFMWDGRFPTLEAQALGPITAPQEMNARLDEVLQRLQSVAGYKQSFTQLFPKKGITAETLGQALASFERTLISNSSAFDKWIQGDTTALSKKAQDGFRIFVDSRKGNCAACHQGGNFSDEGFHNIGLKGSELADADKGRFAIKPVKSMQGAFKTPTLRDLAKSAPYFHDGSATTLPAVIEHYLKGGETKANISRDMKELKLNEEEVQALLEFLNSLNSPSQAFELPVLPM